MNGFDRAIIFYLNQMAQRAPAFDHFVIFLSNSDLMKGGVVLAVWWGVWFYGRGDPSKNRAFLLAGLLGALLALLFARMLAYYVPLRIRPLLDPALHFRPPSGIPDQSNWTGWSSFPSDHAALFCAILTGIWLVSRRAGVLLSIYVAFGICLPRIYVGIHYPSDILAGTLLGVGIVTLLATPKIRMLWTPHILAAIERRPAISYSLLFLLSFQTATLFWDLRTFLGLFDIYV
jgi:undecaprenyl-diphosphatase